jgi:NitT/TauT family transport system permease protein
MTSTPSSNDIPTRTAATTETHDPRDAAVTNEGAAGHRPSRASRSPWGRLPTFVRRALVVVLLLAAWQAYITMAHVSPLLFASPTDVGRSLVTGWSSGHLTSYTATTMKVLLLGMLIGTVAAAVLTTLAVWTTFGDDVLVILTSMINPLPSIAILPLAILWFGLNTQALVFVVANAVVWPIAINVSIGFRTVNPTVLAVGRNIGLSRWRLISDVLVPAALPHTIAGLKTAWAFGWRTIIAAELVFGVAGGKGGLGYFINMSRYYLKIPDVFAGLVTIAVIGILIDLAFTWIERRTVVRWGMKA